MTTTNRAYSRSSMTLIFCNGKPGHAGDHKLSMWTLQLYH